MPRDDLEMLFDEAAELASRVPEPMQAAAFEQAITLLSAASPQRKRAPRKPRSSNGETATPGRADRLISEIDRTKYPQVGRASKALDRALWVLQIANDECEVGALSAPEIANVLTKKFRIKTKPNAVRMALERAGDYVNTTAEGRTLLFELMQPGEKYLEQAD